MGSTIKPRVVNDDEFSPIQNELKHSVGFGNELHKTKRLVCDLNPKTNYVLHITNAKLYLKLGIKISILQKMLYY